MSKKKKAKGEALKTPMEDAVEVSEPDAVKEAEKPKEITQEFKETARPNLGLCARCGEVPGDHTKRTIHMCPKCGMIAKETTETVRELS